MFRRILQRKDSAAAKELAELRERMKKRDADAAKRTKDFQETLRALQERMSHAEAGAAVLAREMESLQVLCGTLAAQRVRELPPETSLAEAEFKVFSQWGEDGIVQFLLAHVSVPVQQQVFIEFGVEGYTEANTRFLLIKDNWRGLILDGDENWMRQVRASDLAWRHTLDARSAWITAENINDLTASAGIRGDIGLLSVDVDGMDYWIALAMDAVRPCIWIGEFNSHFGPAARVTPPYRPDFQRSRAHYSNVFYGASLAALHQLAASRDYRLIGINTAANNAFFVRNDVAGALPSRTPAEVFRPCRYRETREARGALAFASFKDACRGIAHCIVTDLDSGSDKPLDEVRDWADWLKQLS